MFQNVPVLRELYQNVSVSRKLFKNMCICQEMCSNMYQCQKDCSKIWLCHEKLAFKRNGPKFIQWREMFQKTSVSGETFHNTFISRKVSELYAVCHSVKVKWKCSFFRWWPSFAPYCELYVWYFPYHFLWILYSLFLVTSIKFVKSHVYYGGEMYLRLRGLQFQFSFFKSGCYVCDTHLLFNPFGC